ncbi:MAG: hypothetical protein FWF25_02765 [Propionibacteriaceae bacterium]|nr:hypothetical protein [Propionibacteriaceae bacterium]
MTFTFEKKALPFQKKVGSPSPHARILTDEQQAYRVRAKKEAERYANAIEIDLWLCLCFATPEQLVEWKIEVGCGDPSERIWAPDVDWSPWKPGKLRRGFGQDKLLPARLPKPPKDVQTDSYEQDCFAYLESLRCALIDADFSVKIGWTAIESGIYIIVVFPSMDDKKKWVQTMGLSQFGAKYMDGHAVLEVMKRNKE